MARLTFSLTAIALSTAGCVEDSPVPKELPVQIIDASWEHKGTGVYLKENMECSDQNGDGKFDYFRLQDPPDSYQHWVWLDTDHDGFFDTLQGQSDVEVHIPVPRKARPEN